MIREIGMFVLGAAAGLILAAHTEGAYIAGVGCVFLGAFLTLMAEHA